VLAQNLLGAISLDSLRPAVPTGYASFRIEPDDRVVLDIRHDQSETPCGMKLPDENMPFKKSMVSSRALMVLGTAHLLNPDCTDQGRVT
jgi:hypothetical protein